MELSVHRPPSPTLGAGEISDRRLVDLLEVVAHAPKPLSVALDGANSEGESVSGRIVAQGGRILAVSCGESAGREALVKLIAIQQGSWQVMRPTSEAISAAREASDPDAALEDLSEELGQGTEGDLVLFEGTLARVRGEVVDQEGSSGLLELALLVGCGPRIVEIAVSIGSDEVAWLTLQQGKLLEARGQGSEASPSEVLRALIRAPGDGFVVCRKASPPTISPLPVPIPISELGELTREPLRPMTGGSPFGSLPPDEDTADPPTYTPDPASAVRPPPISGPRVVQPGVRSGADIGVAVRRTPAPASPRDMRAPTTSKPAPSRGSGKTIPPAETSTAQELATIAAQLDVINYRLTSDKAARGQQEDQELRASLASLREELARQGAALEALSREPSVARWVITSVLQLATLMAAIGILALAWQS